MKITIKLFARFREVAGVGQLTETVADGATIADLIELLKEKFANMPLVGPQLFFPSIRILPRRILFWKMVTRWQFFRPSVGEVRRTDLIQTNLPLLTIPSLLTR